MKFELARISIIMPESEVPENDKNVFYLIYSMDAGFQQYFGIDYKINLTFDDFFKDMDNDDFYYTKTHFVDNGKGYYNYKWINKNPGINGFDIIAHDFNINKNSFRIAFYFVSPYFNSNYIKQEELWSVEGFNSILYKKR